MMILCEFMFFLCLCSILTVCPVIAQTIELVAKFNTGLVNGNVVFTQDGTGVKVSREELNAPLGVNFSIHEFPVKYEGAVNERCSTGNIGDIFDNCQANNAQCGHLNFGNGDVANVSISLKGQDSVFGRSLTIVGQNVTACATIMSMSSPKIVVAVFRAVSPGIAGTVVFQQPTDHPDHNTAVDINLMLVDARSEPLEGLSFAVYESASTSNTGGSCEGIGEIFNPLGKTSCDKRKHNTCPIGELSAKLGYLNIPLPGEGEPHMFYIDTNLPLSGDNSVAGRSLVILSNGNPLICAKIQDYQTMAAEVELDAGTIVFTQGSLYEPVMVNVSISGGYHGITVHEHMSDNSSCRDNKSGKQLKLSKDSGAMDDLTMYGSDSLMFRALAVKTGSPQKLKCQPIQPKDPSYHLKAKVNFNETAPDGVEGFINIEQVVFDKSKAFAYTSSIMMAVQYKNNSTKLTKNHNWHVHTSSVGHDSEMVVGKKCMSCQGHYNPYKVYYPDNNYASTCKASNPFRCELGDLSSRLGTYDIGGGEKQFIESENYLGSWHNIIGRSVVIHTKNEGAPRLACASIIPVASTVETLNVKNTSKTRDKENFQKVVSEALNIESWRVADVKFGQMGNKKQCLTYTFFLIDDSTSNLHGTFAGLVEDNPDKLKEFVPACGDEPGWKIDEGHSAEIIGVVFGFIILIIFIIAMLLWLRKRRQEHEESSKLVQSVDASIANSETAINVEKNDNPLSDSKKEWNVTTSL